MQNEISRGCRWNLKNHTAAIFKTNILVDFIWREFDISVQIRYITSAVRGLKKFLVTGESLRINSYYNLAWNQAFIFFILYSILMV